MARIKQELTSWKADLNTEKLPDDVTEFSYWVTHNLPLDNGNRHLLLKMNSPVERLRKQLDLIQKVQYISILLHITKYIVFAYLNYVDSDMIRNRFCVSFDVLFLYESCHLQCKLNGFCKAFSLKL